MVEAWGNVLTIIGNTLSVWTGIILFDSFFPRKKSGKTYWLFVAVGILAISCGVICGVLALLYVPTKYIAFFSAIFIMLFAGVSTKYLKKFPHGIRLLIHFFSKQSYRIFLIHHVLLVIIVVPVAIQSLHSPPILYFVSY